MNETKVLYHYWTGLAKYFAIGLVSTPQDSSLESQPRFRRYAIATAKIPELRRLRASFLGRAIHSSLENWQKQVDAILAKAL